MPSRPQLVEFKVGREGQTFEFYITDAAAAAEAAHVLTEIFLEGEYLKHGVRLCPGDTVVDLGAHVGLFGCRALSAVPGGDLAYVGVEPNPEAFEALRLNLLGGGGGGGGGGGRAGSGSFFDLNPAHAGPLAAAAAAAGAGGCLRRSAPYPGNVLLIRAAAAGSSGAARLSVHPSLPANATLRPREKAALQGRLTPALLDGGAREVPVRAATLEQLLAEAGLLRDGGARVALLKVDVEGEELEALRSLPARHWDRVAQVVAEVHDCLPGEFDGGGSGPEPGGCAGSAVAPAPIPDLPGPRGGALDALSVRFHRPPLSGRGQPPAPPPRDGGRVVAVAALLKQWGFGRVVVESPMGLPTNYTVYATRG